MLPRFKINLVGLHVEIWKFLNNHFQYGIGWKTGFLLSNALLLCKLAGDWHSF